MNILALNFFKLLRRRTSKIRAMMEAHDRQKKEAELSADLTAYTLVKSANKNHKTCDMLTSIHMASKHLDQARLGQKSGKAHWLSSKNEQHYKPRELRIDRQLEFIYGELGLSKDLEKTSIGPTKNAS